MKMIGHDHFICHSYCHFSVLSHILPKIAEYCALKYKTE